jgi:hypothetical protein
MSAVLKVKERIDNYAKQFGQVRWQKAMQAADYSSSRDHTSLASAEGSRATLFVCGQLVVKGSSYAEQLHVGFPVNLS